MEDLLLLLLAVGAFIGFLLIGLGLYGLYITWRGKL